MAEGSAPPPDLRLGEPGYPGLLAEISDPPEALWVRGSREALDRTAVGIVGARRATALGRRMGENLGAELANRGVVVVSGCARGVDASAHEGAVSVGGRTVAVLAGGLDVAVPWSNRGLAERILERGGCLISEHPPGFSPKRWTFPRRNRIVAGLCRIVVVVEGTSTSGSLITARLAIDEGREVMAVPGHPMVATAAAGNRMLADGARPVRTADDVLDELGELPGCEGLRDAPDPPAVDVAAIAAERGLEAGVLAALGEAPIGIEALAGRLETRLPPLLSVLTRLEIRGMARAHPGQRFSRKRGPEEKEKEKEKEKKRKQGKRKRETSEPA
ncbi:MAG: DNA-processing protein DprA [Gemmatimonadota bacterium]|nr:DNA-processing protein DprA [Gemmatimonadota bacterium]